jgi:ribosomal protein S18 acetylase RimI-like enzyme
MTETTAGAKFEIARGSSDAHRHTAALIFEEAFGEKQRLAVPNPEKRLALFERALVSEHLVIATRDGELLGLLGMLTRGAPYQGGAMDIPWGPRRYRDLLGWIGAAWAQWGTRAAAHRPAAEELYIDGVAVASAARGLGVGTAMLAEAAAITAELGLRVVRLDVVDTNPRAQMLYERLGYRVVKVENFGYMRRILGVGGMTSMELPVGPGSAAGTADNGSEGESDG